MVDLKVWGLTISKAIIIHLHHSCVGGDVRDKNLPGWTCSVVHVHIREHKLHLSPCQTSSNKADYAYCILQNMEFINLTVCGDFSVLTHPLALRFTATYTDLFARDDGRSSRSYWAGYRQQIGVWRSLAHQRCLCKYSYCKKCIGFGPKNQVFVSLSWKI